MVSKIFSRLRVAFRNLFLLIEFLINKSRRSRKSFDKIVYADISDPRLERYYYLLLKFFELADCQINIKWNLWLFLNLRNYSYLIYNLSGLKIVWSPPPKVDLWLSETASREKNERRVLVDADYFSEPKATDGFILPYNMHPDVYDTGLSEAIYDLRKTPRKIGAFFGGNTGDYYDNPDIKAIFGKVSRKRATESLENLTETVEFSMVASANDYQRLQERTYSPFIFLKKEVRLEIEEWMRILATADFFIALPGFSMPFSHNIVEAMAVGTIPITEYAELFDPPLTDMVNCVSFAGREDLIDKINFAVNLPAETVEHLRRGVIEYYAENFEPRAVVGKIFAELPKINRIYVNAEHLSMIILKEKYPKTQDL